jgi:hypothetical protein
MGLELVGEATDGRKALRIWSDNHYACVSKTFKADIVKGEAYKLSFDYKVLAGNNVKIYIKFRNAANESFVIDRDLVVSAGPSWVKYSEVFVSPVEDIIFTDVYLYAASTGEKIDNLYDNLVIAKLLPDDRLAFASQHDNLKFGLVGNLPAGWHPFIYESEPNNLLIGQDFGFEDRSWGDKASDCSNDLPGTADIFASILTESSFRGNYLELSSRNHFACVYRTFNVNLRNDYAYSFSVEFRSVSGGNARMYVNLRNRDNKNQDSQAQKRDISSSNWGRMETIVNPFLRDVRFIDVFLYSPSDGKTEIINHYDNIIASAMSPKDMESYHLVSERSLALDNQAVIVSSSDFGRNGTFSYVSAGSESAFFSLPEVPYSKKKIAFVYPANKPFQWKIIPADRSFMVSGYGSGWLVTQQDVCGGGSCEDDKLGEFIVIVPDWQSIFVAFVLIGSLLTVVWLSASLIRKYARNFNKN